MKVLRLGRIWALNVGENFRITKAGWKRFAESLHLTKVAFLYVSEHHLYGTKLKVRQSAWIGVRCATSSRLAVPLDAIQGNSSNARESDLTSRSFPRRCRCATRSGRTGTVQVRTQWTSSAA